MDSDKLKLILEKHTHWLNCDCEGWEDMHADLRFTDLLGANLRGANLRGANLQGANLYDADLQGANLCNADLHGADLHGANLCNADLCNADLRGADLRGADLWGANLFGANLHYVDMDYSCLPLWCGSLQANFDSRQLKQIAYHLVKAGLDSTNATDEDRRELSKLIDYANGFHRVQECGRIKSKEEREHGKRNAK